MEQKVYTFEEPYTPNRKVTNFKPIQYVINHESGCWEVYGRAQEANGYYLITRQSKQIYLHRYIYELTCGTIPEGLIVRHKCRNSTCINPEHLELGTQSDIMRNIMKLGQSSTPKGKECWKAKLTENQVKEIFLSAEPQEILAERFGVTRTTISEIQTGKTWRHVTANLTPPVRPKQQIKLTTNQIIEIFLAEGTLKEIAQRFGISPYTVYEIKKGRMHANVTAGLTPPPNHKKGTWKLDDETVKAIFLAEGTDSEIAERFGVSRTLVNKIKNGKVHANITAPLLNQNNRST
jgi:transcriptional regulator with XRE-family HTH domain